LELLPQKNGIVNTVWNRWAYWSLFLSKSWFILFKTNKDC